MLNAALKFELHNLDHEEGMKKSDVLKAQFHASVSQQQIKDAVVDPDVARMQEQMNIWNTKLSNMVLVSYGRYISLKAAHPLILLVAFIKALVSSMGQLD